MNAIARPILQLGCFIVVGALLMVFVTKPGTAEHVISVVALIGGLVLTAAAVIVLRIGRSGKSSQEDE